MKKKKKTMELVLLGLAILFLAYFLLVYFPVKKETEELESEKIDLETKITILQPVTIQMQMWKNELKKVYEENEHPVSIPDYDNISNIFTEMNSIFHDVSDYRIQLSDPVIEDGIATRNISISFSCSSYDSLHNKVERIHDSKFKYQISDLNIDLKTSSAGLNWGLSGGSDSTSYSVSMNVVAYEYVEETE